MKIKFSSLYLAAVSAFTMFADAAGVAAEPRKVRFCNKEYDMDTGIVEFQFGNGKTLEIDSGAIPEETKKQLMLHGISQKVGDSFAGVKGNYAEGVQNAQDTIDQLLAGVWKSDREGDAKPRLAELAEAIARIKSVDLEKATKAVEAADEKMRKEWRSNLQVKSMIATLRAEKAAKALAEAVEKSPEIAVNFA